MGNGLETLLVTTDALLSLPEAARKSWEQLGTASLEANPFYEHWFFLPALRHVAEMRDCEAIVVKEGGQWLGFFPLQRGRATFLKLRSLQLAWSPHAPLCVPLVEPGRADEVLAAFSRWLRAAAGAAVFTAGYFPSDSPVREKLARALEADGFRLDSFNQHERALLKPEAGIDGETYISKLLNSKRRRDQRARERLLASRGTVSQGELGRGEDVARWLKNFLELEAAGWKGKDGGAFAQASGGAAFFGELLESGHALGRIEMLALRLDGRDIGLKLNFRCGTRHFAWKIAYDERHADTSPGVMLELENIRRFAAARAAGHADWMDSCAIPGHPMIERLWSERRPIESLMLGLNLKSKLCLYLLSAVKKLVRRGRHFKRARP